MTKPSEEIKVNQPVISEKTKREMAAFFMRTSIPRILEERRKAKEQTDKA